MFFRVHLGLLCATDSTTHLIDITKFLCAENLPNCPIASTGDFAFFDRQQFPPPSDPTEDDPFAVLRPHLEKAAHQAGFQLVSDGCETPQKCLAKKRHPLGCEPPIASIRFVCNHHRIHRKRKLATQPHSLPLRKTSLHNDKRGNSRGSVGLKSLRKTNSNVADASCVCPFKFAVFLDSKGFWIKKDPRKSKTVCHQNHFKRLPSDIPAKLKHLSKEMKERFGELGNAHSRPAAARNFFFANHNLTLSRAQARCAMGKFRAKGSLHFDGLPGQTESVVDWLRSQPDTSFCVWGAQSPTKEQSCLHTQSSLIFEAFDEFNEFVQPGRPTEVEDLVSLCHEALADHRAEAEDLSLTESQNLFVACAWVTNRERRLFRLSPDVLKFDVTEGTNNEKRPLLTVSARTAFGHCLVIARMLTFENAWNFSKRFKDQSKETWQLLAITTRVRSGFPPMQPSQRATEGSKVLSWGSRNLEFDVTVKLNHNIACSLCCCHWCLDWTGSHCSGHGIATWHCGGPQN